MLASAALVPALAVAPGGVGGASPAFAAVTASTIASEQAAVVTARHQGAIGVAELALASAGRAVDSDRSTLAVDQSAAAQAAATRSAALDRLGSDKAALTSAIAAQQAAESRLAQDRSQLRAIATALYTGEITNPQPASLRQLEADQQAVIDSGEIEVVAGVVVRNLRTDRSDAAEDGRLRRRRAAAVASDEEVAAGATQTAAAASARAGSDAAALAVDESRSAAAARQLSAARAELQADLAAVAGPAAAGGLSVVGAPALDAGQLASWFSFEGYADLTAAPVRQLAAWYVDDGRREGVRGDVAFAQAVLETGGFSSPDAVELNNYAGIGHCDTCASGWTFPSPHDGVDGQLELLQIFSGGSAPDPMAPVLAALVPAQEARRGCCSSWQSLTGIWATDPTYGSQILGIYQQMLEFAAGRGAAA